MFKNIDVDLPDSGILEILNISNQYVQFVLGAPLSNEIIPKQYKKVASVFINLL